MNIQETAFPPQEKRRRWRLLLLLPAVALFLCVTFPGGYQPLQSGLDASWRYAVNFLPNCSLDYGTDISFPCGPLCFLLYPMDIGGNVEMAARFRLIMHLLFGLSILYMGWRVTGLLPALLFMAAYVCVTLFGLPYESHVMIMGALWAAMAARHRRAGRHALLFLSALAALCLFIKPTLSACLMSMLGLAVLARIMQGPTRVYTVLGLSLLWILPFVVVCSMCWRFFFGAWQPFEAWLLTTLEYVRYHAIAMSLEGPRSELIAGVLCVAAFITASMILMAMRSDVSVTAIVLFPSLFTLFKRGFERQDGHVVFFFTACAALAAVLILMSKHPRELALTCVLFLGAALVAIPVFRARNAFDYASALDLLSGKQGLANLRAATRLPETRRTLAEQSKENAAELMLPSTWLQLIRETGGMMDVLPGEIAYCPANGIPWRPSPSVQACLAHTAHLDIRMARHFASAAAPPFLLLRWESLDERSLPFDVPRTWLVLVRNYRLVAGEPGRGLLLLLRREVPLSVKHLPSQERTLTFGEWVDVPSTEGMLLAAMQFRLTPEGHAMKTMLRIPPLFIEFEYADGEIKRQRILPESTANGIIVNRPPLSQFDAAHALTGALPRSAVRFRITGPGTRYFEQPVPMTLTPEKVSIRSHRQLAKASNATPE